jgi:tetratricopeptide (TPR) repeat protein
MSEILSTNQDEGRAKQVAAPNRPGDTGSRTMPSLALSMIVKDGGETLRPCLQSVRHLVQEMVIADTGSSDNTCDIAREFGATVVSFPWQNDFAAARNAALQPVSSDWVLVLDADEELDPEAASMLPGLLNQTRVGGYGLRIRNYLRNRFARMYNSLSIANDGRLQRAKEFPSYSEHVTCRLFRRHPQIRFEGRVHERVENSVRAVGLEVAICGVIIHHFGTLADPESRHRKQILYRELGRLKVQDYPDYPMAWVELGLQEYENFNDPEAALRCFGRALQLDPRCANAWMFVAMIYLDRGQDHEALEALQQAGQGSEGAALREQLKGDALHNLGMLQEARGAYKRALAAAGAVNPLLQSKLGYTEVRLGMKATGLKKLKRAVESAPEIAAIHDKMVKAYIVVDDLHAAASAAETFAQNFRHPKTILRAASIRAQLSEWPQVRQLLETGLQSFPQSPELQQAYAAVTAQ